MGFVYLINNGKTDKYKIGVSKKPPNRIKGLQTGNPNELSITDFYESDFYIKIETILHRVLKHKKYQEEEFKNLPGEWFKLKNEDVRRFKESCSSIEKSINFLRENSTIEFDKILRKNK